MRSSGNFSFSSSSSSSSESSDLLGSSIGTSTPERPTSSPCLYDEATNDTNNKSGSGSGSGRRNSSKNYVYRIREHVKLGATLSEMLIGKMSVGAEMIKKGGRENIFRHVFGVAQGERLLKASQCYLSTTAGPIAGILFVSTLKLAFWSERPITVTSTSTCTSPTHRQDFVALTTPYKVIIPVKNIKRATESENVEKPAQKYIVIVTQDNFEFWFMGFVRYEKAICNLQKAISIYK